MSREWCGKPAWCFYESISVMMLKTNTLPFSLLVRQHEQALRLVSCFQCFQAWRNRSHFTVNIKSAVAASPFQHIAASMHSYPSVSQVPANPPRHYKHATKKIPWNGQGHKVAFCVPETDRNRNTFPHKCPPEHLRARTGTSATWRRDLYVEGESTHVPVHV